MEQTHNHLSEAMTILSKNLNMKCFEIAFPVKVLIWGQLW